MNQQRGHAFYGYIGLIAAVGMAALHLTAVEGVSQTSRDLQRLQQLAGRYEQFKQASQDDKQAQAAEEIAAHVRQRFPARLQYLGLVYLAEANVAQAKYDEALQLHLRILEEIRKLRARSSAERSQANRIYAISLRGVAACFSRLGRHQEAIPYFEQTIKWCRQIDLAVLATQVEVDLAFTYRNAGDFDKALEQFPVAIQAVARLAADEKKPGMMTHMYGHAMGGWGSVYHRQGRFDLAEPKLRDALRFIVSASGWKHAHTAEVVVDLANIYDSQGRWPEAEPWYRIALEAFENTLGLDHPDTTKAQTNLARIVRVQGRHEEAEGTFREILALLEGSIGADHLRTARARLNLAIALSLQGRHQEAEPLLRRVLQHHHSSEARLALAKVRLDLGDADESFQLLARIIESHGASPLSPGELSRVYGLKAAVLWEQGNHEEALAAMRESLRQAEIQRAFSSGAERERASLFEMFSDQFDLLVRWHAELNDTAELFRAIEQKKARSFLDELRLQRVDLLAGLPEEERTRLNEETETLRRRLSDAERRYNELPDSDESAEATATRERIIDEVLSARDALYQHLMDTRTASPLYRELISDGSSTATLAEVQEHVASDELILAFHFGNERSYLVAMESASARFHELEITPTVADMLGVDAGPLTHEHFSTILLDEQKGVLSRLSDPQKSETAEVQLAALYETLIPADVASAITGGALQLVTVIPDGPLGMLPLEALIVSREGELKYLLDVGPPMAYAPSASVLLNLSRRPPSSPSEHEPVLTLGDPAYPQEESASTNTTQTPRQDGQGAMQQFRASLSRLPFSGYESRIVKAHFEANNAPCVQLLGTQATEEQFRRNAKEKEIIHLACHGMASQSYGNFYGALALMPGQVENPHDDGTLSMSEIYELDLGGCELAVLSACQTNYGPQQRGEGVWALSRGFLVAGARRVIASNWVINDRAGAEQIGKFIEHLAKAGPGAATREYAANLHASKRFIRGKKAWKSPFYWSSLVLIGPQ